MSRKFLKKYGRGSVVQWTSHQPPEQKTRVRIKPGFKVFRENIAIMFEIDLTCMVCGFI
jgi:hypothetical protein